MRVMIKMHIICPLRKAYAMPRHYAQGRVAERFGIIPG